MDLWGGGARLDSQWRRMAVDGSDVIAPLKKSRGLDAAVLQAWRLGCCSAPGLEAWMLGLEAWSLGGLD